MTATMVLRLSDIVQGLAIRVGLATCVARFRLKVFWAAGRGDEAPSGDRRAWSQSHGSGRHGGRLAHNPGAVALICPPGASPIREACAGYGCARPRSRSSG